MPLMSGQHHRTHSNLPPLFFSDSSLQHHKAWPHSAWPYLLSPSTCMGYTDQLPHTAVKKQICSLEHGLGAQLVDFRLTDVLSLSGQNNGFPKSLKFIPFFPVAFSVAVLLVCHTVIWSVTVWTTFGTPTTSWWLLYYLDNISGLPLHPGGFCLAS